MAVENSIKQIQVRRDGDQILLKVQMAAPLKAMPGNWSVVEPPRIVFDFPDIDNQSGQTSQQLAVGDLKSLNLVQTDKLTRLVLNLVRSMKFSTEIAGDALMIKMQSQAAAGNAPIAEKPASYYQPAPVKSEHEKVAGDIASVRDILFRRGDDGQANIVIDLTDGTVPIDVRRDGAGLTVELRDIELPERLQNRRDVNDFATPVSSITTREISGRVRVQIAARGRWVHQSNIVNNQLTIEVKPVSVDDANKLVQAGQQGQKVSINFYEAESVLVLRTLAEISGKNVLIDPSLNGRKVTVALDNVPYDQALEIVLNQVNAGMRIRNDVVLFGDRGVLQKREADVADESQRRIETAPLESAVFQLNFAKAKEIRDLLLLGDSSGASARREVSAGQSAGGSFVSSSTFNAASDGAGGGAASSSRVSGVTSDKTGRLSGILSARGTMNVHEPSNKLFVTDIASIIEQVREMIRQVDVPERQVLIEARVVRADTSFNRSLGMRLGYNDLSNTVAGRGVGTRIPGTDAFATFGQTTSSMLGPTGQTLGAGVASGAVFNGPQVNLPISAAANTFAVSIFNSKLTKFINLELQAAESEGRTINISSPRIVTANNVSATIARGTKIPYSTASSFGTQTQFIDATLSLAVKPQIAPNGTVILQLTVTNDTVGAGTPPSINTSKLETKVTVDNGGTAVLGGVVTDDTANTENRVPYLSDLPVLGNFFKSNEKINSKGELLIFITPRILDSTLSQSFSR
ncbi:MAG TPA: type IV pilus secretin PilQ [Rhodocyclaceae bacterium]|nr:type IV pilus secretin PilQ [Rhodocyclaceae bacterium]